MKKSNYTLLLLFVSLLVVGLTSCSKDDPKSPRLQVVLVDAPAEYDGVLVDVQGISARFNNDDDESDESGWTDISSDAFEPGQIDLLSLVNGSEEVLADTDVPAGTLSEIRLLLGVDNALVMGESTETLTVPSGSSSGLKIKLNAELKSGISYKLILDFDAARSVVSTGSGKHNLKPVIHAQMEAQTGAISGAIDGLEEGVGAVVYAVQNEDSVSTYPDEAGLFLIQALSAGTYNVIAVPDADFEAVTLEGVEVVTGDVTPAGTITFEQLQ